MLMNKTLWIRAVAGLLSVIAIGVAGVRGQQIDESALKNLPLRSIGPAVMGGRIDDVAVVERTPWVMYVGSASGGIWKTTNNGTTWEPILEHETVSSIGDIAISPSNPDIVWAGTGEPNNRQSSTFGDGVYKSTDGGRTWTHMGLRDSHHIGRIAIDPVNPNIVYVAALGHLWGPNKERGLFKTSDGGATWTNTKFIDEDTGFVDVAMDPSNREVLYAAAYQRRRVPWGFNGGGPGSGIYKTTDGARTWRKLTEGLRSGIIGRIGLDVWRKDPKVVYATVEHKNGGTFRSDDGGETWRKMSDLNPRPMYYSQIHVDPTNDRRIYVLGGSVFVSNDGGRTWADPKTGQPGSNTSMTPTYDVGVHGDHHALWINPANPDHLVLGNDGGLYFSYDGSVSWDKVNNFPVGQYYAIGVDMQKPYNIYGGLQDTHSWGGPSATRHYTGIINSDWFQISFGDGMYAQVDPTDPDTIYTESQGGNLVRFDRRTGDRKAIKPQPKAGGPPYRFNWTAPLVISPHDPKTLYVGGNRVFRSRDRGETWTASPDLTRAEDRDKLPIMGVLPSPDMLSRHDGVSAWGTITTLAESPVTAGLVWAGTDDGVVQVSRDGGTTWTNVTDRIAGPAHKGQISRVEPSHHDAGTAYVSLDRHQSDDFAPYVFVTRDFGQTWKSISAGLPNVGWVNVIKEHQKNLRCLFVGTETGLFVSVDGGGRWTRFATMPTVPVDDLVIHPRDNDLIVGTHGRSLFVLDDLTPIHEVTANVLSAEAHLFTPRPATIIQLWKHESYGAQRQFIGPNPPQGAIINYYLKAPPSGDVKIIVRDAQGAVVRELTGPKEAGFNRVVWDLRASPPAGVPNGRGPFVLPGRYSAGLAAAGRDLTASVQVEADPVLSVSDADRQARFTFLTTANRLQAQIQRAIDVASSVSKQLTALQEQLKQLPSPPASVSSAANKIGAALGALQSKIGGGLGDQEGGGFGAGLRSSVNGLFGEVDGSGVQQGSLTGPTASQRERLDAAAAEVKALVADLNRIEKDLAALKQEMNRFDVPRLVPPPPIQP